MPRGELPEPLMARRLPKDIGAHEVLQVRYRGEIVLTPQQLRAAMAAAPLEGETPQSSRWLDISQVTLRSGWNKPFAGLGLDRS
jgi:hypothetical protein